MQHDIYLHHYPVSPFAQKVRSILGYKQLAWKSVFQPMVMPKPDMAALTGGYRRIPILQIGNHIVCDTALIADVLEHLAPEKTLYSAGQKGMARTMAQWADNMLFPVAMAYNFQPAGATHVFAGQSPEALKAFAADRQAMRGGAARMAPGDATPAYKSYLRRISSMLQGQQFLLGNEPSIADFAVYHPLWFTRNIVAPIAHILDATPEVLHWMDRMAGFGDGQVSKSNATESIAASLNFTATPELFSTRQGEKEVFQDEHGVALGSQVSITAESFGLESTQGTLVAATRTRYSLERRDDRAGRVLVHFPRIGYSLKPVT
jgi:glutathione S-transferase